MNKFNTNNFNHNKSANNEKPLTKEQLDRRGAAVLLLGSGAITLALGAGEMMGKLPAETQTSINEKLSHTKVDVDYQDSPATEVSVFEPKREITHQTELDFNLKTTPETLEVENISESTEIPVNIDTSEIPEDSELNNMLKDIAIRQGLRNAESVKFE